MNHRSLRIGFHTERKIDNKPVGIVAAMRRDIAIMQKYTPTPCLQIFCAGPRGYKSITTPDERKEIAGLGITVVVHGTYMDKPWGGGASAVQLIRTELKHAEEMGATGVVVHLAKACSDDEKLRSALQGIGASKCILWLEIYTAKQSALTYETPQKIAALFERVARLGVPGQQYGLCIDTAHLWANGMSLATWDAAHQWIEGVTRLCPLVPMMLHLNDSKKEFGGGVDQHDSLCQGGIWRDYHPVTGTKPFAESGLAYLLEWVKEKQIVTILEREIADLHHDFAILEHFAK